MATTYSEACVESNGFNENNDCSVKALSILLDIPYQEAWTALRDAGRKTRRGASHDVIEKALKTLRPGFKIKKFYVQGTRQDDIGIRQGYEPIDQIKESYPPLYKTQNFTVKHLDWFPEAYAELGNSLIFVHRHVLCFKNGTVEDWSKGRRKWVKQIWQLEPIEEKELEDGNPQ